MVYAPEKYFAGLTPSERAQRLRRITEGSKTASNDPRAYRPFRTDKGKKTKPSSYTTAFKAAYPDTTNLKNIASVTGIPHRIIKEVYDKGLAAWRTGHRPGASQQAWGYARVHSFVMKGCTYYTADKSLVKEALAKMSDSNKRKWLARKKMCDKLKK